MLLIIFQDFGDYSDSYYSVQTMEGEQISQLISGYIDIILKKVRDHLQSFSPLFLAGGFRLRSIDLCKYNDFINIL